MAKVSIQISNNAGQSYGMNDYRANLVSVIREVINSLSRKERRALRENCKREIFKDQNAKYRGQVGETILDFVIVNVQELMFDYEVQRDVMIKHISKLLKEWDPKVATPPEVIKYVNSDDKAHAGYWVYDGQQHTIAYVLGNIINAVDLEGQVTDRDVEELLENVYTVVRVASATGTWIDTQNAGFDVFIAQNSGREPVDFFFDYRAGLRAKEGTEAREQSDMIARWCQLSGVDFVAPGNTDSGTTRQGKRLYSNLCKEPYYFARNASVVAGRIAKSSYSSQQLGIPVIRSIATVVNELFESGTVKAEVVQDSFDTISGQEIVISSSLQNDISQIYSTVFGDANKGYTVAKKMWEDMCVHIHGDKRNALVSADWEVGRNEDHERMAGFVFAIADVMGYKNLSGVLEQVDVDSRIYRISKSIDAEWVLNYLSSNGYFQSLSQKKAA